MTRSRLEAPNHTQTPNAFFDVYLCDMGFAEVKVTLAIIRQTFGWHKREDQLSYSKLQELTGLSRPSVAEGVRAGVARGTIRQRKKGQLAFYSLVLDGQASLLAGAPPAGQAAKPAGQATEPAAAVRQVARSGEAGEPPTGKGREPTKETPQTKGKETPPSPLVAGTDGNRDLWERVCEQFSSVVAAQWIRPCRVADVTWGSEQVLVVVEAPQPIVGWVRERYAYDLGAALDRVLDGRAGRRAVVEVRPDLAAPGRRRAA